MKCARSSDKMRNANKMDILDGNVQIAADINFTVHLSSRTIFNSVFSIHSTIDCCWRFSEASLSSHLFNHIVNIWNKFSYWRLLFYLDCHFFYVINRIFMKADAKIKKSVSKSKIDALQHRVHGESEFDFRFYIWMISKHWIFCWILRMLACGLISTKALQLFASVLFAC